MTNINVGASLFETAARSAFRFESNKGLLTVEDLWSLPLRGSTSLDSVAKLANRDVKASEEESFVDNTSTENTKAGLKLEIIKYIISVRKAEIERDKEAVAKRHRKEFLLEVLAKKEEESITSLSKEEILKELENL